MRSLGSWLAQSRTLSRAVACGLALLLTSCNEGSDSPLSPTPIDGLSLSNLVESLIGPASLAVRLESNPPAPNGGPSIDAEANSAVVNGGTLRADISGSAPFTTVYMYVAVPADGVATGGLANLAGHYELELGAAQTSVAVNLSIPQDVLLDEFEVLLAAADASGAVGPYVPLTVTVIRVGTGDIQVTLSWDADSDVDLHVIDPGGNEIYYGRRELPNGAELDLDSNAACSIDGVRNENITWPRGTAPAGTYTVRVDYWDSCGVPETNYTVRINNGGNAQVVTGRFTGEGDQGGAGSGTTVATFTRSSGGASTVFTVEPATLLKGGLEP